MTAAITITAPNTGQIGGQSLPHPFRPCTIAGTGFTGATVYLLQMADPVGGTTNQRVKTDATGNFTTTYVPQDVGTLTVNAVLLSGTVLTIPIDNAATALLPAAAATATASVIHGDL